MRLQFLLLPLFILSFAVSATSCFAQRADMPSARFLFEKNYYSKDRFTGSWRSASPNLGSVRSGAVVSSPLVPIDFESKAPVLAAAAPVVLSTHPSYVSQFGVPRQGQSNPIIESALPSLNSPSINLQNKPARVSWLGHQPRVAGSGRKSIALVSGKLKKGDSKIQSIKVQQYPNGLGYSQSVDMVEEKVHGRLMK